MSLDDQPDPEMERVTTTYEVDIARPLGADPLDFDVVSEALSSALTGMDVVVTVSQTTGPSPWQEDERFGVCTGWPESQVRFFAGINSGERRKMLAMMIGNEFTEEEALDACRRDLAAWDGPSEADG